MLAVCIVLEYVFYLYTSICYIFYIYYIYIYITVDTSTMFIHCLSSAISSVLFIIISKQPVRCVNNKQPLYLYIWAAQRRSMTPVVYQPTQTRRQGLSTSAAHIMRKATLYICHAFLQDRGGSQPKALALALASRGWGAQGSNTTYGTEVPVLLAQVAFNCTYIG